VLGISPLAMAQLVVSPLAAGQLAVWLGLLAVIQTLLLVVPQRPFARQQARPKSLAPQEPLSAQFQPVGQLVPLQREK
jgi:hypothetical protein